jgi:hypothetical protein
MNQRFMTGEYFDKYRQEYGMRKSIPSRRMFNNALSLNYGLSVLLEKKELREISTL